MKRFFVFLVLLVSVSGQGATNQYLIKSQLYINGKLISSPTISTLANEPAELTQVSENPHKELKFKVVASDREGQVEVRRGGKLHGVIWKRAGADHDGAGWRKLLR